MPWPQGPTRLEPPRGAPPLAPPRSRLLRGLLPDALLDLYHFWQRPDDSLTGYPNNALLGEPGMQPTLLLVTLSRAAPDDPVLNDEGNPPGCFTATVRRRRVHLGRTAVAGAGAVGPAAEGAGAAPPKLTAGLQLDERWERLESEPELLLLGLQTLPAGSPLAQVRGPQANPGAGTPPLPCT